MKQFYMNDIYTNEFIKALNMCKGKVYLVTEDGDRFNLRSTLSQLAGIFNLIEGGKIVNAKIYCSDLEDESMLFRYNLFGEWEELEKILGEEENNEK